MYNNDVTYDKKWDTPENIAAFKKLQKKYFHRTPCSSDCPNGWAPEVLEMMDHIDNTFGIKRKPHNTMPYGIDDYGDVWRQIKIIAIETVNPEIRAKKYGWGFTTIEEDDSEKIIEIKKRQNRRAQESLEKAKKLSSIIKYIWDRSKSLIWATGSLTKCRVLDWWYQPVVTVSQVKEKYGSLRLYAGAESKHVKAYIKSLEEETILKLSMKGAYYTLKNIWNAYQREYNWPEGTKDRAFFQDFDVIEEEDGTKELRYYLNRDKIRDLWRKDKISREDLEKLVLDEK